MQSYKYKAYNSTGGVEEGEIEAECANSATRNLKKNNLKPVLIAPVTRKKSINLNIKANDNVSDDDIEFITAELSLLLQSGVKIDKALNVLASAKSVGPIAILLQKLSSDVRQGASLSSAMEKHPDVFDSLYVNLVKIGEASGNLPEVFLGLSQDLKYKKELKSKILQAITYPLVIFFVCVGSVLFIFNFVVPKLSVMFADATELPIYTQALLGISSWIQSYQVFLGVFLIAAFYLIRWLKQQGHFSNRFDEIVLKTPIFKNAILLIERIRFTSSMSLMLASGVKIDQALSLSSASIKNKIIARTLSRANDKVRKGDSITSALKNSSLMSNLFISLLEVGEESGNMAPVFEEISSRSRAEFTHWTTRMTSLLEPLMILFMGGVVGSVVVIMLMSIVSVNEIGF